MTPEHIEICVDGLELLKTGSQQMINNYKQMQRDTGVSHQEAIQRLTDQIEWAEHHIQDLKSKSQYLI